MVPLNVLFWRELDLINRRDRGARVWSEKHLHKLAYYPTTPYWDTVGTAVKKMAKAMVALMVAKIVVKGTEPEFGVHAGGAASATSRGVAIAKRGAVGVFETSGGDELVSGASRCSPREAVVKE